jgi:hypothetical protein
MAIAGRSFAIPIPDALSFGMNPTPRPAGVPPIPMWTTF